MRKTTIFLKGILCLTALNFAGCHASTLSPDLYHSWVRLEPSSENSDEYNLNVVVWTSNLPPGGRRGLKESPIPLYAFSGWQDGESDVKIPIYMVSTFDFPLKLETTDQSLSGTDDSHVVSLHCRVLQERREAIISLTVERIENRTTVYGTNLFMKLPGKPKALQSLP